MHHPVLWGGQESRFWGKQITDLRSLLPPDCLLTAALPLALVPRNCNPASPGLLPVRRAPAGGRVRASGCTSLPPDPAALLPALRCHVRRRQVRQRRGAGSLLCRCLASRSPRFRAQRTAVGLSIPVTYMKRRSEARRSIPLYFSGVLAASFRSRGCMMNGSS
ncbi:hypothetical protein FQA47_003018 [Oryzias melastigma]|uniref:Uncharacterized protein n=1 Tax=Oryzias melastigma TaxID=30732 RepID=A0A834CJR5_ORYME|nr:hypothetical protein FQA47_003018 [Oryzias melastigma]